MILQPTFFFFERRKKKKKKKKKFSFFPVCTAVRPPSIIHLYLDSTINKENRNALGKPPRTADTLSSFLQTPCSFGFWFSLTTTWCDRQEKSTQFLFLIIPGIFRLSYLFWVHFFVFLFKKEGKKR